MKNIPQNQTATEFMEQFLPIVDGFCQMSKSEQEIFYATCEAAIADFESGLNEKSPQLEKFLLRLRDFFKYLMANNIEAGTLEASSND